MRLLIVEDEPLIALDLELLAQALGHEVCATAPCAQTAVAAAAAHRPDLVLMDVRLARGTDGIAAAIQIRRRFGIPALFLSGSLDRSTLERAQASRPLGFLEKPFSAHELERMLHLATEQVH